MAERVKAWQCIGCGSIEAPQTCVGVCEHHKVEFVYAGEHAAEVADLRARLDDCLALARRLALTTPRRDRFEASYRALQHDARALLARHAGRPAPRAASRSTTSPRTGPMTGAPDESRSPQ